MNTPSNAREGWNQPSRAFATYDYICSIHSIAKVRPHTRPLSGGGMFIREKGSLWRYIQNTYRLHMITYRSHMTTYNYIQITYSVCYHICITYGYIHSIYFTYGYIQFTYWPFSTAFGDSDDEGGQDPSFHGGPDLADPDLEPDAHDPAPVTAAPDHQAPLPGPASIPPFHFMNFISKTGDANVQTCIKDMDRQMQDYPSHVPSKREAWWTCRHETKSQVFYFHM